MTTVSPFKDGANIQTVQGILRGVGPMGPRGYQGAQGLQGPQGIPGPQPDMEPVAAEFKNTATVAVTNNAAWQTIAMTSNTYLLGEIASLQGDGSMLMQGSAEDGISAMFTVTASMRPGASGTASFVIELGLFAGTAGTPFASSTYQHTNGATVSTYTYTAQRLIDTGTAVYLKARTWAGVSPDLTATTVAVVRAGGPTGPQGPQGIQGIQGEEGPIGLTGSAGGGYANFDALSTPFDSDADPSGSLFTNQNLPYPVGTQKPAVPFLIKNLAAYTGRRIVRRFTASGDVSGATDREAGQINYLTSNNSLLLTINTSGSLSEVNVAQVRMGTGNPAAGTYPPGTIYCKVI